MSIRISATLLAVIAISLPASAAVACSSYERQVYDVAQAVASFRQSHDFTSVYGWGRGGPYAQWLDRLEELRDDRENATRLLINYGFVPMEIYTLADEFRTAGRLDAYFQELDEAVNSLVC